MNKIKKILVIMLSMLISFSSLTFAADNTFVVENLYGNVFLKNESIDIDSKTTYDTNVEKLNIQFVGNKFKLSGKLNYGKIQVPFTTMGYIYPVNGDGGYYDNKLLYGDFEPSGKYSFPQVRIEANNIYNNLLAVNYDLQNKNVISLMIEDTKSGNLYYVQGSLSDSDFNEILSLTNDSINYKRSLEKLSKGDTDETTVGLMDYRRRFVNRDDKNDTPLTSTFEAGSNVTNTEDNNNMEIQGYATTFNELNNFLNALKNNKTVNASNYSTTIKNIMTTAGWNGYADLSSLAKFSYNVYVVNNLTRYYIIISLNDISFDLVTSRTDHSFKIRLLHGMQLEYDIGTNKYDINIEYKIIDNILLSYDALNLFQRV